MAAWWTNPEGKRLLVLEVFGTLDGVDGYDCFAVEMTRELAQALLARIERVKSWKAQDDDLSYAKFWDYAGEYYSWEYDSPVEDREGHPPPRWVRGDFDSRTEMDHLEVGCRPDGWVGWSAWVKHSDPAIKLTTQEIREEELRRFVAGDDPWDTPVVSAHEEGATP
jgi:hypothetical protein